MNQKPEAVIPDNLSEMSPQSAWNLALNTIAPLMDWNSFWNDGLDNGDDIRKLLVSEKPKKKIRYRAPSIRLTNHSSFVFSK